MHNPSALAQNLPGRNFLVAAAPVRAVVLVLQDVRKAHRRGRFGNVDRGALSAGACAAGKKTGQRGDIGRDPRGIGGPVAHAVKWRAARVPLLFIMPDSAWTTISGPFQARYGPIGAELRDVDQDTVRIRVPDGPSV